MVEVFGTTEVVRPAAEWKTILSDLVGDLDRHLWEGLRILSS